MIYEITDAMRDGFALIQERPIIGGVVVLTVAFIVLMLIVASGFDAEVEEKGRNEDEPR